jgi:putative transposase
MIDRNHDLPISRQAKILNISRSSVYYKPRPVSTTDLALMRRIDELHLEFPFAGSRMLRDLLNREGVLVGRRHVATAMKRMGVEAIYRRPNTSKPAPGHKIYPYLLRGLKVDRPNQAWAMDITYIPMARGFVYLAAVVDWFSRRVLSHRVSITMEAEFCIEALEEALVKQGKPEIFNTDQGSQFTSEAFTSVLIANKIAISMDGKGAWRDNVFVERIWKSVKYEEVYLHAYDSVGVARASIARYLDFYNCAIEHPFVYVIVENRFCCAGSDPVGYLGFWRARSVIDRAVGAAKAPRANIQGPSGSGWIASISPASAARRKVFGATFSSLAASPRLSHGSTPSAAAQNTGIR